MVRILTKWGDDDFLESADEIDLEAVQIRRFWQLNTKEYIYTWDFFLFRTQLLLRDPPRKSSSTATLGVLSLTFSPSLMSYQRLIANQGILVKIRLSACASQRMIV
jgi:hypothetical protein